VNEGERPRGPGPFRARARTVLALALGLAVAILAVGGALLSSHLSPGLHRPLLDGFAPPPPYRWVKPPPDLASQNQPPDKGAFSAQLTSSGSDRGIFSTQELQASLFIPQGAIAPEPGQQSVTLNILPLDPAAFGPPPKGYVITGNVYRFQAVYVPGGKPVTSLVHQGELSLSYPGTTSFSDHSLVSSTDGRIWTLVRSSDQPATQIVSAHVVTLGPYAVVQAKAAGVEPGGGSGSGAYPWLVVGLVVAVALVVVVLEVRHRRARPAAQRKRGRGSGPGGKPRRG
jgi:hypothetical protein